MKITIPHSLGAAEARRRIESRMSMLKTQYGRYIDDVVQLWQDDTLFVDVRSRGLKGTGKVEVGESEVTVEGELPLMARMFEGKIKSAVEREAEEILKA